MSKDDKNKSGKSSIKSSFFDSVYVPTYTEDDAELVRSFQPKSLKEIQDEIKAKVDKAQSFLGKIPEITDKDFFEPRPLTDAENAALGNDKERMLGDIKEIREMISEAEAIIDSQLNSESSKTFTYNFKKKPKLRKAVKVISGVAENKVTYETYKKALALKTKLEEEDAASFFEEKKSAKKKKAPAPPGGNAPPPPPGTGV